MEEILENADVEISQKKARSFVFTVNNYNQSVVDYLKNLDKVKYMICGAEVGELGTPHLQGYVMFENPRSIKGIVKVLKGHVEVAMGSPSQNVEYCSKQKILFERGTRPKGEGTRTDIQQVKDLVKAGAPIQEIWENARSYQAFKMAEIGLRLYAPKRNWKPEVLWYWGPTETGKSRKAVDENPGAWMSGKDLKWWHNYEGEEVVILDDFRGDFCTFHELLRILDRYPYVVEVKGGHRQLLAKKIIITSPYPPMHVYKSREDINQLIRRIDKIEEFRGSAHGTEVGGNNIAPTQVVVNDNNFVPMDRYISNELQDDFWKNFKGMDCGLDATLSDDV